VKVGLRLEGERADGYVAVLRHLLAVARPGAHFVDARRLDAQLSFLGPAGSRGVAAGLEIDEATGLPTLRELLRVRADRDLAGGFLREHAEALPAKAAYYRALAEVEVLPTTAVDVRLVGVAAKRARFEVVHDRLDAAAGMWLRYTVLLEQHGADLVRLERGDLSVPSERFTRVVMRYAGADAELALLLLAELEGVTVREVVRGQIGPLSFEGVAAPPAIAAALRASPGGFVLHLAVERAGAAVTEERCRDPWARLYRDALGAEARAAVEARRAALGYRVAKDRRLACTPGVEAELARALARAGVKLVVRSR
jgi:hypothetical protein